MSPLQPVLSSGMHAAFQIDRTPCIKASVRSCETRTRERLAPLPTWPWSLLGDLAPVTIPSLTCLTRLLYNAYHSGLLGGGKETGLQSMCKSGEGRDICLQPSVLLLSEENEWIAVKHKRETQLSFPLCRAWWVNAFSHTYIHHWQSNQRIGQKGMR